MTDDEINEVAKGIAEDILRVVDARAKREGISRQKAFDRMLNEAALRIKRRKLWGTLPDEYDPAVDPDHLGRAGGGDVPR